MNCRDAQDWILEAVEPGRDSQRYAEDLRQHLTGCATCRSFLAVHNELDLRLARAIPAPALSPTFRSGLRKQIRREPLRVWPDLLPDIVHLGSCGAATLVCALLLPFPAGATLTAGAAVTAATYLIQTVFRNSLEEIEEPRWL
jgi:hypothetical protein